MHPGGVLLAAVVLAVAFHACHGAPVIDEWTQPDWSHGGEPTNQVSRPAPAIDGDKYSIHIDQTGSIDEQTAPMQIEVETDENTKTFTLRHARAPYLTLHWKHIQLSSGTELKVCDGDGQNCDHPHRQGVHTFWDYQVAGDTIVMVLTTTDNEDVGSFEIDQYAAGWPLDCFELTGPGIETYHCNHHSSGGRRSVCGTDDRENAICYQDTLPAHYGKVSHNVHFLASTLYLRRMAFR